MYQYQAAMLSDVLLFPHSSYDYDVTTLPEGAPGHIWHLGMCRDRTRVGKAAPGCHAQVRIIVSIATDQFGLPSTRTDAFLLSRDYQDPAARIEPEYYKKNPLLLVVMLQLFYKKE